MSNEVPTHSPELKDSRAQLQFLSCTSPEIQTSTWGTFFSRGTGNQAQG